MQAERRTRMLILGGGFGGVTAAQGLRKQFKRDPSVAITLINRDNYFLFQPMLASAAAGSIGPLHAVTPIRHLLKGVSFRAEEVAGIDLGRRVVTTVSPTTGRDRELPYDHLVIALGNVINLARLPGVAQHAQTIKTLGDALAIRNHVLQMLEAAEIELDPGTRREMLTFVVAGGGFSGVEMVGELNDMAREVIKHYPSIQREDLRVLLLHSGDRILPEMTAGIAEYALKQLRKRGVEVMLNVRLAGATPHEALLERGPRIPTRTLIVAVGNAPPPVIEALPVQKDRGKIVVDPYMRVPGAPGVWALGDNAIVPNAAAGDGSPSPPTAQFAVRQGKQIARNIAAMHRGQEPAPFGFGGLGQLCLVGHGSGVGELKGGIKLRGLLGWLAWRNIYLSKMPKLSRRIQVAADWTLDLVLPRELAQVNLERTHTIGRQHYEAGEFIFRQGDPGDHFYLIADGEVEVIREHSDGSASVAARLHAGDYFGETALLSGGRRNATIRCLTPVNVVTIGRDDFAALAGAWGGLAESVQAVSDDRATHMPRTMLGLQQVTGAAPAGTRETVVGRLLRSDTGAEIPIDTGLFSIGRSPENNIIVADAAASRRHALVQNTGGVFTVEDLGGQNGTWVNGTRIAASQPVQLNDGDRLRVGGTEFIVQLMRRPAGDVAVSQAGPLSAMIRALNKDGGTHVPRGDISRLVQSLDAHGFGTPPPAPAPLGTREQLNGLAPTPAGPYSPPAVAGPTPAPKYVSAPAPAPLFTQPPAAAPIQQAAPSPPVAQQPAPAPTPAGSPAPPIILTDQRPLPPRTPRREFIGIPHAVLVAIAGPRTGERFEVGPHGLTIGRTPDNALVLPDGGLSRQHARIVFGQGAYWLEDLGSTNGTHVNGTRLTSAHPLRTGDVIQLGGSRFDVSLLAG